MAILLLKGSNRAILIWMFLWALWTAILRPLSGNLEKIQVDGEWVVQLATDSMRVAKMQTWEFWERAGNWGPPFILLVMGGAFAVNRKDLFSNYQEPEIKESTIDTVFFLCKTCLALLLIGHAGFGFAVEKQMLINHWQSIGVDADIAFITKVGYAEFALGVLIFLAPLRPLILVALLWKLYGVSLCASGYGCVWESNIFRMDRALGRLWHSTHHALYTKLSASQCRKLTIADFVLFGFGFFFEGADFLS